MCTGMQAQRLHGAQARGLQEVGGEGWVDPCHRTNRLPAAHLALRKTLEEVGLSGAVRSNKAVAASDRQLDAAVLDELRARQAHGETAKSKMHTANTASGYSKT